MNCETRYEPAARRAVSFRHGETSGRLVPGTRAQAARTSARAAAASSKESACASSPCTTGTATTTTIPRTARTGSCCASTATKTSTPGLRISNQDQARTRSKTGEAPAARRPGGNAEEKEMTPAGAKFSRCRRWRYLLALLGRSEAGREFPHAQSQYRGRVQARPVVYARATTPSAGASARSSLPTSSAGARLIPRL